MMRSPRHHETSLAPDGADEFVLVRERLLKCAGMLGLAATAVLMTEAQGVADKLDLSTNWVGFPPGDFDFRRTGDGSLGSWTVVRDPTAVEGIAIEHISTDQTEDRFPLAIYKALSVENIEARLRLKIVSGFSPTAGLAVCLRDPGNYYAVGLNVFEQRVDLFLFSGGRTKHIQGAEVELMRNHWHSLGVMVNDDHFTVSVDQKVLFTTFDRTRMKDGRFALWTQEDNIARFDEIEVRPLPGTEGR
jgi:hypothetical protein